MKSLSTCGNPQSFFKKDWEDSAEAARLYKKMPIASSEWLEGVMNWIGGLSPEKRSLRLL